MEAEHGLLNRQDPNNQMMYDHMMIVNGEGGIEIEEYDPNIEYGEEYGFEE